MTWKLQRKLLVGVKSRMVCFRPSVLRSQQLFDVRQKVLDDFKKSVSRNWKCFVKTDIGRTDLGNEDDRLLKGSQSQLRAICTWQISVVIFFRNKCKNVNFSYKLGALIYSRKRGAWWGCFSLLLNRGDSCLLPAQLLLPKDYMTCTFGSLLSRLAGGGGIQLDCENNVFFHKSLKHLI